jgi:hypothetical protein
MRGNEPYRVLIIMVAVIATSLAIPGYAQQNLIHIISPASGFVVQPGQTVMIGVTADSSVQKMVLIGQHPLGMAQFAGGAAGIVAQGAGAARPLQFQLTIPTAIQPGVYRLTAVGRTSAGPEDSETLALDVERPDNPARIWAEPSSIQFTSIGDRIPVLVLGVFADGSRIDLTRSSKTKFASADPGVASLTSDGIVTAVGEGKTSVLIQTPSADYSIPVRVAQIN